MKYKLFLILIIIPLTALFFVSVFSGANFLHLIFFDVGQGDASLIILPDGRKILIDGGPNNQVLFGLGKYLNFFDRNLDLLILSHEHDDHLFGLVQVIKRYRIGKIIHAASYCKNSLCQEFFETAKKQKIEIEEIDSQQKIIFAPDCILDLYPPENLLAKNINNRSIAFRLDCFGAKILLAGDGELAREEELLFGGGDLSATVFKASHHGSNTSNSENFIKKINPSLVVIPVGAENNFKHPASSTLEYFKALGIKYFRTDKNGNISLKFFGKTYPQVTIDKE